MSDGFEAHIFKSLVQFASNTYGTGGDAYLICQRHFRELAAAFYESETKKKRGVGFVNRQEKDGEISFTRNDDDGTVSFVDNRSRLSVWVGDLVIELAYPHTKPFSG